MASFAKFSDHADELAVVIAFDPGGTTGYCVLGVEPSVLDGSTTGADLALQHCLEHVEYGEIDCGTRHGQTGVGMARGHDGLNINGEYAGIIQMVNVYEEFLGSAIVVEDFILDVTKANMGRELLTPVRIIAGFSTMLQYSYGAKELNRFFIQNRSLAKTTCTDMRLKNWGLYDGLSGPHARDATRHAFYFLRDCRGSGIDARRKRHHAWPDLYDDPEKRDGVDEKKKKAKSVGGERILSLG